MQTIKKKPLTQNTSKALDSVKMMRDIRDKIGAETKDMSFTELKEYVRRKIKESKLKPLAK